MNVSNLGLKLYTQWIFERFPQTFNKFACDDTSSCDFKFHFPVCLWPAPLASCVSSVLFSGRRKMIGRMVWCMSIEKQSTKWLKAEQSNKGLSNQTKGWAIKQRVEQSCRRRQRQFLSSCLHWLLRWEWKGWPVATWRELVTDRLKKSAMRRPRDRLRHHPWRRLLRRPRDRLRHYPWLLHLSLLLPGAQRREGKAITLHIQLRADISSNAPTIFRWSSCY